jgi:hypothetical protein
MTDLMMSVGGVLENHFADFAAWKDVDAGVVV